MRHFIRILFTLCGYLLCNALAAQEVKLDYDDPKNRAIIYVKLYDSYNGDFLKEVPLTFHITKDYTLFMIVGDDTDIKEDKILCLFDKTMDLSELKRTDRNLKLSGQFKQNQSKVYSFYEQTANFRLIMPFQNHREYIYNTPRPLFFQVKKEPRRIELKLRFYVATPTDNDTFWGKIAKPFTKNKSDNKKYGKSLLAESKVIKVTIDIIK